MLRRKLSFLLGRRREGALPLQRWGDREQDCKRQEVVLSLVTARPQELKDCRWIMKRSEDTTTSRLNWD